ncbi:hypothetical protein LCGC14_1045520 [marine sediment metagenome]|uniref:Uncharacterized protein n=1 Tax=marine sediment metagenome TaxID=412755 RepID=A0A0F9NC81_9ZZZZ
MEPLSYWKEKLKEDLYFSVNIRMYMINYHNETGGYSVRKEDFTKTFMKWLIQKNPFGEILTNEIERRKKSYNKKEKKIID